MDPRAAEIKRYWMGLEPETLAADKTAFKAEQKKLWFGGGKEVDAEIVARFSGDLAAVKAGQYDGWLQASAREALAGVVLMDQLARNAYRGSATMYALDPKCLSWAKQLTASSRDDSLTYVERLWVGMPLMHSEDLEDQEACVVYMRRLAADAASAGAEGISQFAAFAADYGAAHRDVIAKWGRFPHRNALLGRKNTAAEAAGLADGSIPAW